MEDKFDLHQTIIAIQQAMFGVICHMVFDFAVHGLALALTVGTIGLILNMRKNRFGRPLMNVCRRISVISLVLASPGVIAFLIQGHLPPTGVYNVNSIGFLIFWSLLCLHLSAEEMNYCFFIKAKPTEQ